MGEDDTPRVNLWWQEMGKLPQSHQHMTAIRSHKHRQCVHYLEMPVDIEAKGRTGVTPNREREKNKVVDTLFVQGY